MHARVTGDSQVPQVKEQTEVGSRPGVPQRESRGSARGPRAAFTGSASESRGRRLRQTSRPGPSSPGAARGPCSQVRAREPRALPACRAPKVRVAARRGAGAARRPEPTRSLKPRRGRRTGPRSPVGVRWRSSFGRAGPARPAARALMMPHGAGPGPAPGVPCQHSARPLRAPPEAPASNPAQLQLPMAAVTRQWASPRCETKLASQSTPTHREPESEYTEGTGRG
jgi:hypothetical protein